MTDISIILDLRKTFSESILPWVVSSLRHDEVIWQSLQDPAFRLIIIEKAGTNPENWLPGYLSLIANNIPIPSNSQSHHAIDAEITCVAANALDLWKTSLPQNAIRIEQAGLIAIALRNRFELEGSWDWLINEIKSHLNNDWQTPLVCLYSLCSEPMSYLQALIHNHELFLHVFLSNPLPPQIQIETLGKLLHNKSQDFFLALVNRLYILNPSLASAFSRHVLRKTQDIDNLINANNSNSGSSKYLINLQVLADQPEDVISTLKKIIRLNRKYYASLIAQLAYAAGQVSETEIYLPALEQATKLDPSQQDYLAELILAYLDNNQIDPAEFRLPDEKDETSGSEQYGLLIAKSRIANFKDKRAQAREFAIQATAKLAKETLTISEMDQQSSANFNPLNSINKTIRLKHHTVQFSKYLLNLSLPREAIKATQLALKTDLNNPDILFTLSRAETASNHHTDAIYHATLATALAPNRLDIKRHLAKTFENSQDWDSAIQEWINITNAHTSNPPANIAEDHNALARCYLRSGEPERTVDICRKVIELKPDDGLAHTFLGQALIALGDIVTARTHLKLGPQLTPHEPYTWLSLANDFLESNETEHAIEALRAASKAVPDNPDILLAVGKTYLEQNALTQAIKFLRSAAQVQDSSKDSLETETALYLGRALHKLGHLTESQEILKDAFNAHPNNPEIASSYAEVLLRLNKMDLALTPLRNIVEAEPKEPFPYLDLAEALLKTKKNPDEALQALKKAKGLISEGSQAHNISLALTAEALSAIGELTSALQTYKETLKTQLAEDPTWKQRLAIGLSKVAIKLHKPEDAISTLQDATNVGGNNPKIYRLLSEAYLAANLHHDAFQIARTALKHSSGNLDSLFWFTDKFLETNLSNEGTAFSLLDHQAQTEAINALTHALQLSPERIDLGLRLGKAQFQIGDLNGARETLSNVLSTETNRFHTKNITADFREVAKAFSNLDDYESAIACLEKAEKISSTPSIDLIFDLSQAKKDNNDLESALDTINRAVSLQPDLPDIQIYKTDILTALDRPQDAIATLNQALFIVPDSPELHDKIAFLLRTTGNLLEAFDHAEKSIGNANLFQDDTFHTHQYFTNGADLARSLLKYDRAREILAIIDEESIKKSLQSQIPPPNFGHYWGKQDNLAYHALCGELALEDGDDSSASTHFNLAKIIVQDHPRTLALQSRCTNRRGDYKKAIQIFEEAKEKLNLGDESSHMSIWTRAPSVAHKFHTTAIFLAIADAATELGYWEEAVSFLLRGLEIAPDEPILNFKLVINLVLRAEVYHLCENLKVLKHAPGKDSVSEGAYQLFENAIVTVTQYPLPKLIHSTLNHWHIRGVASFRPKELTLKTIRELPATPEDVAAQISILHQSGKTKAAIRAARQFPSHPSVLTQLSITLEKSDPKEAFRKIQTVGKLRVLNGISGINFPILHSMIAQLAIRNNQLSTAGEAIDSALAIWSNEPRWHALAAELKFQGNPSKENPNLLAITNHLTQAIKLEPSHIPHYIKLASIFFQVESYKKTIEMLEKATQISPTSSQPWFYLAQAHKKEGDLRQASFCAEKSIKLDPDRSKSIQLRAEIALEYNDPELAYKLAKTTIEKNSNDFEGIRLLAKSLITLNRLDEAQKVLEKAIPLSSNLLPLQMELVDLLNYTLGPITALNELRNIAKNLPNNPTVLIALANSLAAEGYEEEAIQVAQQSLQSAVDGHTTEDIANIHVLLGSLLRRNRQFDSAINQIEEAIKLAPNSLDLYLELALTHKENHDHESSLKVYQLAIDKFPEDAWPYFYSSLIFIEIKDYKRAEDLLRIASKIDPEDVQIQRQLDAIIARNLIHELA